MKKAAPEPKETRLHWQAEFAKLARETVPLQNRIAEISVRHFDLAQKINLDILTEQFPEARVVTIQSLAAVKPVDSGMQASSLAEQLKTAGRPPTLIIVDMTRKLITLAEE